MTDAFADLVGPIFRYGIELQQGFDRGEHPPLAEVREKALALLADAERRATGSSQAAHDFALARYALVYWLDEVLINSAWQHSIEWGQHILEWDLFRERLRAERFYERAQDAEALAGTDPLETFFLAVALGFRGRHADAGPGLQRWADRAYARIAAGSQQPERFLPDEVREGTVGPLRPLPGKTLLLGVSILVSATALVTLACFLISVHLAG
jgi:type VI secretion system protein ImpK